MTQAIFSDDERRVLLAVKGVGPTVIARLEQLDIGSLRQLATEDVERICTGASMIVGSSCWKNSPQAHTAISNAIAAARTAIRS